MLFATGRFQSS